MIQNNFDVRSKSIDVFIDEVLKTSAHFEFVENGVTHEYGIKAIGIDKKAKSLTISYYHQLKDGAGNLLNSESGKFEGSDQGEFDLFYDKTTLGTNIGVDFDKAALNGLMQRVLEGAFCYNPFDNYNFFQPLVFDLNVTEPSEGASDGEIDVVMVNGSGTLKYNIDGGSFGTGSSFVGLATGTYTIGVRSDEEGVPFYKTVTI